VAAAAILLAPAAASAQVTIDNDLPIATLGHWSVDVLNAGDSTTGRITANRFASMDTVQQVDIIFAYTAYIDVGNNGGGVTLITTTTVAAALSGDDEVTSSGSFVGANGNTINWSAVTSIPASSPIMTTVFTFTAATGTLGVLRFLEYLDEDVQGTSDDVLFVQGAAASNDLELFTVDNAEVFGVSHGGAYTGAQGLAGATFAGWAADQFPDLRNAILVLGAMVSPTGVVDTTDLPPIVHPVVGPAFGPDDITSVLAWDVDPAATTATILTTLGGVPEPPQPGTATPTATGGAPATATPTATATATSTVTSTPNATVEPAAPEIPTLSSGGAVALALLLLAMAIVYLGLVRRGAG
jgi:hypothetical protein